MQAHNLPYAFRYANNRDIVGCNFTDVRSY